MNKIVLILLLIPVELFSQVKAYAPIYPPLVNTEDGVTVSGGLSVEIVLEAAKRAGIKLDIEIKPFSRALNSAKNNLNTLIFPLIKDSERDKDFLWLGPVNRVDYYLYRLNNSINETKIDSIFQIKDSSVGVLNGDIVFNYLSNNNFTNIYKGQTIEILVRLLLNGRLNYIITTPQTINNILNSLSLPLNSVDKILPLNEISTDRYSYLSVKKGSNKHLISSLQIAIESMIQDGTWDEIFNKYITN